MKTLKFKIGDKVKLLRPIEYGKIVGVLKDEKLYIVKLNKGVTFISFNINKNLIKKVGKHEKRKIK